MPRYFNRKSGQLVEAVQFNGPDSIQRIVDELRCGVCHRSRSAVIYVDGVPVYRGQYVVATPCAVVSMDQERFDARFRMQVVQGTLF